MKRYVSIGIMSGSSLDGLDIALVEFVHDNHLWTFQVIATECFTYTDDMEKSLSNIHTATAWDYQQLHHELGKYIGTSINQFIEKNNIVDTDIIIGSHGHTVFHEPAKGFTSQIGSGAAIAAITGYKTITDLRAIDVALGGQGAPIVPIGEYLLWNDYQLFLNIEGIANLSFINQPNQFIAFDVCAANRVLNLLSMEIDTKYDRDGLIARSGNININLLEELNKMDYYKQSYPKSLNNSFGTDYVMHIIHSYPISIADGLSTYTEHIALQIANSIHTLVDKPTQLLITGGGALNIYLIERLRHYLNKDIHIVIPQKEIIDYKEAIIMAFMGVLRMLEIPNVLSSVTGSKHNSINGCIWNV